MKKKIIFIGIFLVVLGILFWWFKEKSQAKKKQLAKAYTVKKTNLEVKLDLSGHLAFDKEANLRFQTSGLLSWVGVKTGQTVHYGQAIASLDRRELYKQLKKALNNYYNTRLDFENYQDEYRDLLAKSPQIKRILEKSQKNLDNAVINVELQHLAWQLAVIKAPFNGLIDELNLPVAGQNITPSQATIHLIDPKSVFFEAEIDELDLNKVQPKEKVEISLDAYPNLTLPGEISYISYSPSKGKNGGMVYLAKIQLTKLPDNINLRAGLNGTAKLILAKKNNLIAIPSEYLNYENGKSYVWLLKNGQKTKQWVKTGLESDEAVEITSGLKPNDVIVQ